MALKRNRSSGSDSDFYCKKLNLQTTPEKVIEFSEEEKMSEPMETNVLREEAINTVKKNSPEWFGGVFEFLLNDLDYLRGQSARLEACSKRCQENEQKVERLETRVTELESTNAKLKDQITKLEDYSRKNNLIVKGINETGPNEKTEEVVANFLQNTLQIADSDAIQVADTHRLGKPPHLISRQMKTPRDIIVRFQSGKDRKLVWSNRSKLKNSKFVLSEDFSPATQEKVNKLLPIYKAARRNPDVTRCQLIRDVLVIDGQKFTVDTIDSLPYGLKDVNPSEKRFKNDRGVAFFGKSSFMSNFHESPFTENGITYRTVEQYYQHKKAGYFKDDTTATAILRSRTPNQAKALSYRIKDYDPELWQPAARRTMHKACLMKFQQNPILGLKLKQTAGIIVEANPKDQFFSCGLSLHNPNLQNQEHWIGQNLLGEILCEVRDCL